MLRLDPGLHEALRSAAAAAGLSLNEYCARKLAAPGFEVSGPGREAVERALTLLGGDLRGVVAFGSWARGAATESSDVDLLMVASPSVGIRRSLYHQWDRRPWSWEGRPVEPHFVHLPPPGGRVSGLWAEAAVDGIVLFERDVQVSKRLVDIRRRIVSGKLQRRTVYGQPYWVEAA